MNTPHEKQPAMVEVEVRAEGGLYIDGMLIPKGTRTSISTRKAQALFEAAQVFVPSWGLKY